MRVTPGEGGLGLGAEPADKLRELENALAEVDGKCSKSGLLVITH